MKRGVGGYVQSGDGAKSISLSSSRKRELEDMTRLVGNEVKGNGDNSLRGSES